MQIRRRLYAAALPFALSLNLLPAAFIARAAPRVKEHNATAVVVTAQGVAALERGYRTGYSDGYQGGYRDSIERAARDYRSKEDYTRADRAYLPTYGAREDYQDGYRQGFESGYTAGFDRQDFNSTVPTSLVRRGAAQPNDTGNTAGDNNSNNNGNTQPVNDSRGSSDSTARRTSSDADNGNSNAPPRRINSLDLPLDTMMRVELLTNLSTDTTQRGDRFEARVIEPREYEGAQVTGRVTSVKRPGRVRGSGELQLDFEQISLPDGRYTNFRAQVVEVVGRNTGNVGDVDEEGGVRGRDTTKDDVTKVGAGAGIGAVIGAIAGGGKGAAIGAIIGGGVGAGGAISSRGKDVRLERGQQLLIRTSTETRIQ